MPENRGPCYVFGEFTLDVSRACLLRAGEPVSLRPQAFDALRYLVEHSGKLATKDELVSALWPRSVVTDDSLVKCIQDVRNALGDGHRYVKTVPRRGYILDVPVEADAPEGTGAVGPDEPAPARRIGRVRLGWATLAAASIVAVGGPAIYYFVQVRGGDRVQPAPSIAVLPFLNLSSDGEQDYFADGLAEELLNRLAKFEGLRVAARTSSFTFRDSNQDAPSIAAKLGVGNVLEGSVRKAGNEIRVTAQLIDGEGGTHLWSATYERELDDIFAIQEEIAQSVAAALSITLGINDREKLRSGTQNVEAFDHYVTGLALLNEVGRTATARGIERVERATEIDPEYAEAWSLLSLAYVQNAYYVTGDFETAEARAERAARRALQLNSNMVAAHAALAYVHMFRKEWALAEEEVSAAVSIPSNFVATWDYAELLETAGYLDEALEYRRLTRQALPLNIAPAINLAVAYHTLGDRENAEKELSQAVDLVGDRGVLDVARMRFAMARGDDADLRRELENRPNRSGEAGTILESILDSPDGSSGARGRLREMSGTGPPLQRTLSLWAAYFGEPELAVELLRPSALSGPVFAQLFWDPVMHEARGTRAFKDVVRELRLVDFWRTRGWPTFCRPVGVDDFACD